MKDRIHELMKDEKKSILELALKLSEESGEVAEAILALNNSGGSTYKDIKVEDALEECVDTILVSYVLFEKLKQSYESEQDFEKLLSLKVDKWSQKMM